MSINNNNEILLDTLREFETRADMLRICGANNFADTLEFMVDGINYYLTMTCKGRECKVLEQNSIRFGKMKLGELLQVLDKDIRLEVKVHEVGVIRQNEIYKFENAIIMSVKVDNESGVLKILVIDDSDDCEN